MKTLKDTLQERLAGIKDVQARKAAGEVIYSYVPTGLKQWDANGGLLRGILTVIGAATGEGKSIVKLQLARAAAKALCTVCMVDFEDPREKTADRVLSESTGINNKAIGLLDLEEFDVVRIESAVRKEEDWASRVTHHAGLLDTTDCFNLMEESGAELILVDYAQAFPEDDGDTMERTIAHFAWKANELAQRKNCAVVVFSQVVRAVEERGYRTFERARFRNPDAFDVSGFCPTGLSDVAWAKTLGERSKELLYLWRPHKMAIKLGAKGLKDDRMRIIAGKVNFGEEKDMVFKFDGPRATIEDL